MSGFPELFEVLVKNSEAIPEIDFRLLLENIYHLNPGSVAPEFQALLSSDNTPVKIKMNLIRISGYIQDDLFLLPLKRILDLEKNIHLKKEALIAISKYKNRKAFNILNQVASKLQDPLLLNMVKNEIAKIKQDNPILALLPNFLLGDPANKLFKVSIQILKRLLNSDNVSEFVPYLAVANPAIRDGAFEILCSCADSRCSAEIRKYFLDNIFQPDSREINSARIDFLLDNIALFLSRNSSEISAYFKFFRDIFDLLSSREQKKSLVTILSRSGDQEIFSYLVSLLKSPEIGEEVVRAMAASDPGARFLIESGDLQLPRQLLITSLLQSETGARHIAEKYREFSTDDKFTALKSINGMSFPIFKNLLSGELLSENFQLQSAALETIASFRDFSFREILMKRENQLKFEKVFDSWSRTLTGLFPLDSFRIMLGLQTGSSASNRHLKHFLKSCDELFALQPVWDKIDPDHFLKLLVDTLGTNNRELTLSLLNIYKNFKTLDKDNHNMLVASLKEFNSRKEASFSSEELSEIKRVRDNILENFKIFQNINEGQKLWQLLLGDKENSNFSYLERILKEYHYFFFVNRREILAYLSENISLKTMAFQENLLEMLSRNPYYSFFFFKLTSAGIRKSLKTETAIRDIERRRLQRLQINIMVEGSYINNCLENQLRSLFAEFEIVSGKPELPGDILIASSRSLKELILEKSPVPERLYICLEQIEDFGQIKSCNPVVFPNWNLFKIVNAVIRDLLALGQA